MTKGEEATLAYLENEFQKLGLQHFNGWSGFRQAVPLARINTDVVGSVTLLGKKLLPQKDIDITSESFQEHIALDSVPVIFVGYGITATEFDWDDYQNVDVKNKIVVTLVNDPGFTSMNRQSKIEVSSRMQTAKRDIFIDRTTILS